MKSRSLWVVLPLVISQAALILAIARDAPLCWLVIVANLLGSILYFFNIRFIPRAGEVLLKKGFWGIDLNKYDIRTIHAFRSGVQTQGGTDKAVVDDVKRIPESLGVVTAFTYFIGILFMYGLLRLANWEFDEASYMAGSLTIIFTTFLGFVDDVVDIRWRYKIWLPYIASIPLIVGYKGSTVVRLPRVLIGFVISDFSQEFFQVNLGYLFHFYMTNLLAFCSNAVNIYAGVNGLEVGQTYICNTLFIVYAAVELFMRKEEMSSALTGSLVFCILFQYVSAALLHYNYYPSRVFVGDTFTILSGAHLAVVAIMGHSAKTLILLFIPQIINFLLSFPQLVKLIDCPRHRIPFYCSKTGKMRSSKNLTLINKTLELFGEMEEKKLVDTLLFFQLISGVFGLCISLSQMLLASILLIHWAASLINDSRFVPVHRDFLKSRGLYVEELYHRVTKAKLVAVAPIPTNSGATDRERAFAVSFRTPALDDTGVTHVLEHSVFEGSRKYPVMNSIGHFERSSMATFVNAMTAPETTMYPVATVDKTDLLNLASVYMDGVFDPLILSNRTGFDREGWHYLYDDKEDKLSYGGVVYNEMKGVYSNPRSIISRTIRRILYENSTLGLESGGHPEKIPTLTYEFALNYYMIHYHPSNAYFYLFAPLSDFYQSPFTTLEHGPSLATKVLDLIDRYTTMAQLRFQKKYNNLGQWTQNITSIVLPQIPSIESDSPNLESQTNPSAAEARSPPVIVREVVQSIPSSNRKTSIRIDSLIDLTQNYSPCELQAINVLSILFCSSKESPLWRRLEAEKIGEIISGAGITTGYPAIQFALQIDNLYDDDVDLTRIKGKLFSIISEEVQKAFFSPTRVYSVVKRMELSLKAERSTQSGHAMSVFDEIIDPWVYHSSNGPFENLERVEHLNCVKDMYMNNTRYFTDLLQTKLHPIEARGDQGRKIVVMKAVGDPDISTEKELKEKAKLEQIKKQFSKEKLLELKEYADALESAVNKGDSQESLSTLPTLDPENIVKEVEKDAYQILPLEANSYMAGAAELRKLPTSEKFTSWMLTEHQNARQRSLNSTGPVGQSISSSDGLVWKRAAQMIGQYPNHVPAYVQLIDSMISKNKPMSLQEAVLPFSLKLTVEPSRSVQQSLNSPNELSGPSTPMFFYDAVTGGLVFVSIHIDLNDLSLEELGMISLFDYLFNHGHVNDMTPSELRETLDTFTGGLSVDWSVKDTREYEPDLVADNTSGSAVGTVNFRCLIADFELCTTFIGRIIMTGGGIGSNADNLSVVLEWLKREINSREQSVLKNSNSVASQRVRGKLNLKTRVSEIVEGTESVSAFLQSWLDELESYEDLPLTEQRSQWRSGFGGKLDSAWAKLFKRQNMAFQVTADNDHLQTIKERLIRFISKVPERSGTPSFAVDDGRIDRPAKWASQIYQKRMGVKRLENEDDTENTEENEVIPWEPISQDVELIEEDLRVNFNYWLVRLQNPGDPTKIAWSLFSRILTNKYLTPKVRMIGGAYGVWSTYSYHDGYVVFGSYRDPARKRTYTEYGKSPSILNFCGADDEVLNLPGDDDVIDSDSLAVKSSCISEKELAGYIIRFIADMDKPVSLVEKSNRQFNRWSEGVTERHRQQYRQDILSASGAEGAAFRRQLEEKMLCSSDYCEGGLKVSVGRKNKGF